MKKVWVTLGIIVALNLMLIMLLGVVLLVSAMQGNFIFGPDEVAIVNIKGEISQSQPVIDLLHMYEKRPKVKAIVLRVDSPGGSVSATQEIYEEVNKIRQKGEKPVIASFGSMAASGGYYVACAADKIVANPGTLTGSIGVLISIMNMQELLDKIGINIRTITSGEHKDAGSIARELTPEEEKLLKEVIDNIHGQFMKVVEERRALTQEQLSSISDGRIFTGEQALENHLIDKLGNLDDAIDIAAEAAGIKGEPKVIEYKKRFSLLRFLLGESQLESYSVAPKFRI